MFLGRGCGCVVYIFGATIVLMMIAPFLHPFIALGIVVFVTLALAVAAFNRAAKMSRGFTYYEAPPTQRQHRQRNLAGRDVQAMNRLRTGRAGFFDYNRTARAPRKINGK